MWKLSLLPVYTRTLFIAFCHRQLGQGTAFETRLMRFTIDQFCKYLQRPQSVASIAASSHASRSRVSRYTQRFQRQ